METLITVVHIAVALFIVLVVLVQGGNSGGVGAAFGGGSSSSMFGATGANTFFSKLTYGAAITFMLTSITLTVMKGKSGKTGLEERLKNQPAAAPVVPSASPVGSTTAASATPVATQAPAVTK